LSKEGIGFPDGGPYPLFPLAIPLILKNKFVHNVTSLIDRWHYLVSKVQQSQEIGKEFGKSHDTKPKQQKPAAYFTIIRTTT